MDTVEVLLSTYNGEEFLCELMDSLVRQDFSCVRVLARDDGSTDRTLGILSKYSDSIDLRVVRGCHVGLPDAFFSLLDLSSDEAAFFAFADQDDVWRTEKLSRAISHLRTLPLDGPAMYCSAETLADKDLHVFGQRSSPPRRLAFENALVQNVAQGCTIVINRSARDLLLLGNPQDAGMHDWWVYLVVSALGVVAFDPWPSLLHRQHGGSVAGTPPRRWTRWARRARSYLAGQALRPATLQATDFRRIYGEKLTSTRAKVLDRFIDRRVSLVARLAYALSAEVYCQSYISNIILRALLLLDQI